MANWLENILQDDVRALLIAAVGSLGLLVFLFLILGLRSKRRANRVIIDSQKNADENHADKVGNANKLVDVPETEENLALGLIADQIGTTTVAPGMMSYVPDAPNVGMAETILVPPPPLEKISRKKLTKEAKLLKNIKRLEKQSESVELAELYSERGTLALKAKDMGLAQEYFLKGLTTAGQVIAPEQQAYARKNLGDVAFSGDDLTTACEHWQLARDHYLACGKPDLASEVEDQMTKNQCPTDWVLNGF